MSDNINDCHLYLVYVSDGPKTRGTFFPIEHIPLDDPLHPEHVDNTQQRKNKAGGSASKRCQVKSSSKSGKKTAAQEPTTNTNPNKKFPCTPSKFGKTTAAQEPTTDTNPNKKFPCTLSKSGKTTAAQEPTTGTNLNKKFPCTPSKSGKTTVAKESCPHIWDVG